MRIKSLLLVSLVFGAASLAGCGGNSQAETGEKTPPPVAVEAAGVQQGEISATYSGTATLEARNEADVVARVGGVIREVLVEEGDRVEAGQVLARLEDERLKLEVARARAELGKLEQEYQRLQRLHAQGLVSKAEFERQKYELESLQAALQTAELELGWTRIRAPIDGVVSARYLKQGNMIQANEAAFHLVDFTPMIAELHVPETALRLLKAGQPARLEADALPGLSFDGRIERINPVIDPATGTFKVTVLVDETQNMLRPGLFVRVGVVHDVHADALLVPRTALVNEDAETAVYVVNDGKAEKRVVTTGYADNGRIEILSGLEQGDMVVTVGQSSLRDGSPVTVINQPEPDDTALAGVESSKTREG